MDESTSNAPLLLAACLIVRDEADAVGKTIASLRGVVDCAVLLDTGSVDGTVEAAARAAGAAGVPLRVLDHLREGGPFEAGGRFHYGRARNAALDVAARIEPRPRFVLSLSADEALVGGDVLRAHLAKYDGPEDALLVEVRTPTGVFFYPRVLRVGSFWRYEGQVHEEPRHALEPDREPTARVDGCRVEYAPTDPLRTARRLREIDGPLLREALASESRPDRRARVAVLLGQTAETLGVRAFQDGDRATATQEMLSALGYYKLVETDEGAPRHARHFAAFKCLNVAESLGIYGPHEMLARLRPLADREPSNPAIAYMVATHTAAVDARAGIKAAERAAEASRRAVQDLKNPHDPHGLLWRPYLIIATCARALGAGYASTLARAVDAGLAAGGPREAFEEFRR